MPEFNYVHRAMVGERDTRHEAIGDLAKHWDWDRYDVVPITDNCLVGQVTSLRVGPRHLGDEYYNDRDYLATKHGAVRIEHEELVRFVNNNRQDVVESKWSTGVVKSPGVT
jgi:hypothetical protein